VNIRISQNVRHLRKSKNMTQNAVADYLGVGKAAVSGYESGKGYPSFEKLVMLAELFGVSLDDLVYGELSADAGHVAEESQPYGSGQRNYLVPVPARAGYSAGWDQQQYDQATQILVPGIEGEARTFEVEGDSMAPALMSGDYAVCRPVRQAADIANGAIHVIVTNSTGIHCKYVTVLADQILAIPANKQYKPYRIDKEDVKEVWRVVMKLSPSVYDPRIFSDWGPVENKLDDVLRFLKEKFPDDFK